MSSDWFCKIGEKKVGPLNGQQLKTFAAKGQLKPEHLVRRGSEGPWVPAGRIKGLFPEGSTGNTPSQGKKQPSATAKPLPKAAVKPGTPPTAKATSLPSAAEAPAPPAADIPPELSLGGHHKHHVEMNVDSLNIQTTPVAVSRRKLKTGLKGLKQEERKKLTILLLCLIGGGMTFGLVVILWAVFSGKVASPKPADAKDSAAVAQAADSGKKTEQKEPEKKAAPDSGPVKWTSVSLKTLVGNVEVNVLKPTRGQPPKGAKTEETDVLVVPVTLELKGGNAKEIELTSWSDGSLKKKVSLKDDKDQSYGLLEQVNGDSKTITSKRTKVQLIFQAPTGKTLKFLHLTLPPSAFHAEGPMIGYEINPSDIKSEAAKSPQVEKTDKATKVDEGDPGDIMPKDNK